jgi:hypothetical protein
VPDLERIFGERATRRRRLLKASQHFSSEVERREHVRAVERTLDSPPYLGHHGYYREHKHPLDQEAEAEEAWRFA